MNHSSPKYNTKKSNSKKNKNTFVNDKSWRFHIQVVTRVLTSTFTLFYLTLSFTSTDFWCQHYSEGEKYPKNSCFNTFIKLQIITNVTLTLIQKSPDRIGNCFYKTEKRYIKVSKIKQCFSVFTLYIVVTSINCSKDFDFKNTFYSIIERWTIYINKSVTYNIKIHKKFYNYFKFFSFKIQLSEKPTVIESRQEKCPPT